MILNSPTISGSLTVTGNILTSGSITLSGSVASASFAATASFVALAQSASNAVAAATASSADNLLVRNTLTAQTLVVQTITSSVDFVTGSTRFGSILSNTHVFSGSVTMNPGGLFVSSSGNVGIGTTPNTTAGITELAIGSSNTNPLISGIRDGVSAFALSSDSSGTRLLERRNLELTISTNNTTRLTIANTGAATFSGSVTINGAATFSSSVTAVGTFKTTGGVFQLYNSSTFLGGLYPYASWLGSGTDYAPTLASNTDLYFTTGDTSTKKMIITSGGNVGIGVTNPSGSLSIKAEPTNTPTVVFQNSLGGPHSAISNYTSAVQTFTIIGTNFYVNSTGNVARFNTSYEGSGITFDEGILRFSTGTSGMTPTVRLTINNVGTTTFSGEINSSMGNDQLFFNNGSATTGYTYMRIANTSGGLLMGIEGTTAGNLQSGDVAYSSVITTRNASNLSLGTDQVERLRIAAGGAITIAGSLSKGSGTFRIDHPLESKKNTHQLVHSFVEGPRADLIYRGKVTLINGTATINIDKIVGMTEGTFVALNRDVQCFTTNESGWDLIKGKVEGNILTITSQNSESTDEISWMVVGERQDKHIKDTDWTDSNGKPILEPLKSTE